MKRPILPPCPACAAGECFNCPGDTWVDEIRMLADCPCYARGHRDHDPAGVGGDDLFGRERSGAVDELVALTGFDRFPVTFDPPLPSPLCPHGFAFHLGCEDWGPWKWRIGPS